MCYTTLFASCAAVLLLLLVILLMQLQPQDEGQWPPVLFELKLVVVSLQIHARNEYLASIPVSIIRPIGFTIFIRISFQSDFSILLL